MIEREQNLNIIDNPDTTTINGETFSLASRNLPNHLHNLLEKYDFRRCNKEEIDNSIEITENGWPGLPETTKLDLYARDMINAPMCGVFNKDGKMLGYSRLLWGLDNKGVPEAFSHMTAVHSSVRDGGIGEALKWLSRQISLEFPVQPVTQLAVTFDNLQGRNCYVNLNKLGMVCGYAGGIFTPDAYVRMTGKQHLGNPADRYKARWHLNSKWTIAHLENNVKELTTEDIKSFPDVLSYEFESATNDTKNLLPVPKEIKENILADYVIMPIPLDWDTFLELDSQQDYKFSNSWRLATREAITTYHSNGYTTVSQIRDLEKGVNLQIMIKNFNPFDPPSELLRVSSPN